MPTKIEWTHVPGYKGETWNPVTGCTKISPGCANCYAETMLMRFHRSGPFLPGNLIQLHEDRLGVPLKWKAPRSIFVNSVSDTFHEDVPDSFLDKMFAVMALTPQHIYQLLTKRPDRMLEYMKHINYWRLHDAFMEIGRATGHMTFPDTWPLPNVWLGTSAENQYWANDRVPKLLQCPAVVHFVSCEPLLSHIDLYALRQPSSDVIDGFYGWHKAKTLERVYGLDQVIVGGESGNSKKIRPMHPEWVRHLRDQTKNAGAAFFFKQWGSHRPRKSFNWDDIGKTTYVSINPHERHFKRALKYSDAPMIKGSKGGNGHILDGEVWQEFPQLEAKGSGS